MSTNKADIQQIQKYLNGELDAKAMHALEKQAQDDPFLMDAIEGYQNIGTNQQANFNELKTRFGNKINAGKDKQPVALWRIMPVAAGLLVALAVGFLLFRSNRTETPTQVNITKTVIAPANKATEPAALADMAEAKTDGKEIAGIVTDQTGHALANVKVSVKGSKLKAVTDSNGRFKLASANKGVLNIAARGFDAKQVKTNGGSLKVVLNESANELARVSVVAYVEDDKPANKTHPTIGWKAFRNYLREHARMDNGETGLVKLAFTVGADGMINGIHVTQGTNETMNQKAIDLVLNGPLWKSISENKEMRLKILFRKGKDS